MTKEQEHNTSCSNLVAHSRPRGVDSDIPQADDEGTLFTRTRALLSVSSVSIYQMLLHFR